MKKTEFNESKLIESFNKRIEELEKEVASLKPKATQLHVVLEDGDQELTDELTSRIIFSIGDNVGVKNWDGEYTIDFYCGPETKGGYLLDWTDCGVYDQLDKLFVSNNLNVDIGAAENYHVLIVPDGEMVNDTLERLKNILVKAGAVERNDN